MTTLICVPVVVAEAQGQTTLAVYVSIPLLMICCQYISFQSVEEKDDSYTDSVVGKQKLRILIQ